MKIAVTNFRGIASAEFTLEKIVLICGDNRAGKSSILEGMGACVTASSIPYLKPSGEPGKWSGRINKSEAGIMVRTGAGMGSASVVGDGGAVTVSWPSNEVKTVGSAPWASVFAAGLIDYDDLSLKERASILLDLLKATPTKEDLAAGLKEANIPDKTIEALWNGVAAQGWDAAWKLMKEQGVKFKGTWEDATGERYGERKGSTWTPVGWSDDLASASVDGLKAEAAAARTALENDAGGVAVDKAERERTEKAASSLPALLRERQQAVATITTVEQKIDELTTARAALPPDKEAVGIPCPYCEKPLKIALDERGARFIAKADGEPIPKEELQKRRTAIASADGKIENVKGYLADARKARGVLDAACAAAEKAAAALETMTVAKSAKNLDAARERVRAADDRLGSFERWSKSRKLHDAIHRNQAMIDALAPDGVRAKKLKSALQHLNDTIASLLKPSGWGRIYMDEAFEVRHEAGGKLPAASEAYQSKVAIQYAFAKLDGSEVVIVDGSDILGKRFRNGLLKIARDAQIPTIVAATANDPEEVPDLPPNIGASYWVQGGMLRPLSEAVAAKGKAA